MSTLTTTLLVVAAGLVAAVFLRGATVAAGDAHVMREPATEVN